jgi:hypothetical protein
MESLLWTFAWKSNALAAIAYCRRKKRLIAQPPFNEISVRGDRVNGVCHDIDRVLHMQEITAKAYCSSMIYHSKPKCE